MEDYLVRCYNCEQLTWNTDLVSMPVHQDEYGDHNGFPATMDEDFCIKCAETITGKKVKVTVSFMGASK